MSAEAKRDSAECAKVALGNLMESFEFIIGRREYSDHEKMHIKLIKSNATIIRRRLEHLSPTKRRKR